MSIQVLSLLNGAELIGTVSMQGNNYYVSEVFAIVPQQGQSQQMSFGFAPWPMFGRADQYTIGGNHVVVAYEPIKEIIEAYQNTLVQIKAAKSGLVVPQNNRVVPSNTPRLILE